MESMLDDLQCRKANEVTAANAGERLGLAGESRVGLSSRLGVAEFHRWASEHAR